MLMILTALRGIFGSILSFLAKHPVTIVIIVVAICSGCFGYVQGSKRVRTAYEPLIAAYQKDAEDRRVRIKQIEEDSVKAAKEAQAEITAKNAQIKAISDSYEARLADLRKNPKIKVVEVEVSGVSGPTEIIVENGLASCHRLPSAYVDTLNDMVDAANGTLKGAQK